MSFLAFLMSERAVACLAVGALFTMVGCETMSLDPPPPPPRGPATESSPSSRSPASPSKPFTVGSTDNLVVFEQQTVEDPRGLHFYPGGALAPSWLSLPTAPIRK